MWADASSFRPVLGQNNAGLFPPTIQNSSSAPDKEE